MSILMILTLGCALGIKCESHFSVSKVENTGVIFEETSKTLIYTDRWTILTTINLKRVSVWKDYLVWSEDTIEQICGHSPVANLNQTCEQDIANVRYITNRIRVSIMIEVHGTRTRRGVFDGAGTLSKFLFGTMDNNDAENIHMLQTLENNDRQNLQLIKEQVILVKSNYEENNKILEEFNSNLESFKGYVSEIVTTFNSTLNKVILETNSLINSVTLNEAATNIILHLEEIEHQINSLYIILNSLTDRHLHPLILSYQQVADTIKNLHSRHPLHDSFQNPFLMQQIATVESAQAYDLIFCKISVPLVQRDWFSLKKIYPLPITRDGITTHFEIARDYLVTNDGASIFIPVHDNDVKACTKVSLNMTTCTLVCQFAVPIYTSPEDNCLLLLYKGWAEATHVCNAVPMLQNRNTIIKMATENSWLYIFQQEAAINVECSEFQTVLKLADTGILTLKPNCKATLGNIILTTSNILVQNISIEQVTLIPKTNKQFQTNTIPPLKQENSPNKLQFVNSAKHSEYLQYNKNKLEGFLQKIDKEQTDRETRSQIQIQTTHSISLVVLACLTVLSTIVSLVVFLRQQRNRGTNPQPKYQNRSIPKNFIKHMQPHSIQAEVNREEIKQPRTISEPNLLTKIREPSIPITTPTVKSILPENRSTQLNISDFEIV